MASSLHEENESNAAKLSNRDSFLNHPAYPILFDPQTSGGLLMAIPSAQTDDCMAEMQKSGLQDARIIGRVSNSEHGPSIRLE